MAEQELVRMNVNERIIGPELGDAFIRPDGERLQIVGLFSQQGQEWFRAFRMTGAVAVPVEYSAPLRLRWDEGAGAWRIAH